MKDQKNIFIIAGSIIVAGIIIGAAVLFSGAQGVKDQKADLTAELPTPPEEIVTPDVIEVGSKGYPFIGDKDAPVTIIEVSDFECPFCNRFTLDTLPELKETYVDEGIVKFVFRDFPLPYHPFAQKAAEATLCVYEQEDADYYEYHMMLHENSAALDIDNLKEYAEEVGVDADDFAACLDDGDFEKIVKEDFEEMNGIVQNSGLDNFGTPGFFVNGRPLIGAQPFSAFEEIIEEELAKIEDEE